MLIIMLVFAHFRSASIRFDYQNADFSYIYGWNNIFTCFYMPAFFVISGFLSNFKKNIRPFLHSLFKGLIIPLLALSLINDISYAIVISGKDLTSVCFDTIQKGGTLWFLQALILAKLICYAVYNISCNVKYIIYVTFFLLFIGIALNQLGVDKTNFFFYQHGFVASFFVALGMYMNENKIWYAKASRLCLYIYPFISILSFWKSPNITAYLSVSVKMIPLFLLLSIGGTIFLMSLCEKVKQCRILEFWGRNSLVVYALHFTPLVLFFNTYYNWLQPTNILQMLEFVVLLYITEYALCYVLIKVFQCVPFKWLLGKF